MTKNFAKLREKNDNLQGFFFFENRYFFLFFFLVNNKQKINGETKLTDGRILRKTFFLSVLQSIFS